MRKGPTVYRLVRAFYFVTKMKRKKATDIDELYFAFYRLHPLYIYTTFLSYLHLYTTKLSKQSTLLSFTFIPSSPSVFSLNLSLSLSHLLALYLPLFLSTSLYSHSAALSLSFQFFLLIIIQ